MTSGRRARAAAAALIGLVVVAGCTSEVTGTATAAPGPGADGIGDPYFPLDGNGGYDVDSYTLDLHFDPDTDVLGGTATIVATATQDLSAFDLDFLGFDISSATVEGEDATTSRDGGELTVTPATDLADGAEFTTVIAYEGVPQPLDDDLGLAGFIQTDDGALAVGQPHVAADWFPVNDHPADAATVDLTMAVPEGLQVVSNGALLGSTTQDGSTTWHWAAEEPMASYLVTVAIGHFDISQHEQDGIRYWDAVDPALDHQPAGGGATVRQVVDSSLAVEPEAISMLSDWFGPYPFDVAGGIVDDVPDLGFALEDQTRPVYSPVFFSDVDSGEVVVVHELAHQWAGDSVRLARWRDVWLNEGFATYAEWLWGEHQGTATPQERFDQLAELPAGDDFWRVAIGNPGPHADQLFAQATYSRGAMTLQALRTEVGDDAFRQILRRWFASEAGQAVTTDDFIALAEDVSGRQLDDLFAEWLGPGKPAGLR